MEIGFKLDLNVAAKASQGGRMTTGLYKVEIVKNFLHKTEKGNNLVDLELRSENGEVGFINRLCIDPTWVSGSENFDYPKWQELAASAGMQTLTTFASKRNTQNGEEAGVSIQELMGKVVTIAVYKELDVFENKETSALKIANTFLADGRSITEAQAGKPADRSLKIADRLADFETPEHKLWKAGAGQACVPAPEPGAPIAAVAPVAAPLPDVIPAAEQQNLFGQ